MRPDIPPEIVALVRQGKHKFDTYWNLTVANGSGTFVDLSERIISGNWSPPNPNNTIGRLSLRLLREIDGDPTTSIAPEITASALNKLNDGITYSPLIKSGRAHILKFAIVPRGAGRPTDPGDFYEAHSGRIYTPNWTGEYGEVDVTFYDHAGILQRTWTENARLYPAGTLLEEVLQGIVDDEFGVGAYPIAVPVGSGYVIDADFQPDGLVWPILTELAQKKAGWPLWIRYDALGNPYITYFEPERSKELADAEMSVVYENSLIEYNDDSIRTVVEGYAYTPEGEEIHDKVENAAKTLEWGGIRRFMRLVEPVGSVINSYNALFAYISAALSDTEDPDKSVSVRVPFFPSAEVAIDRYEFAPLNRVFDTPQLLAPFEVTHEIIGGGRSGDTIMDLRGRPSAGAATWIVREKSAQDSTYLSRLETYIDGALSDNLINASEAKAIGELKRTLEVLRDELGQEFADLLLNPLLSGTAETDLSNADTDLSAAYANLVAAIDAAVDGNTVTDQERDDVSFSFDQFRTAVDNFRNAASAALDSIRETADDNVLDTALAELLDVETALDTLENVTIPAIADGVIGEAEAVSIGKQLAIVRNQKAELDQEYTDVYANPSLTGAFKTNLQSAKTSYNTAYSDLVAGITLAIADSAVTPTERSNIESWFLSLDTYGANLRKRLVEAVDAIKDADIDTALDTALAEILDVETALTALDNYVDGAFADGIISEAESIAFGQYLAPLNKEKAELDQEYAGVYGHADLAGTAKTNLASAKTSYDTAHTNLTGYITTAIADSAISGTERSGVASRFATYSTALASLRTRLTEAADYVRNRGDAKYGVYETFQSIPPGMSGTTAVSIESVAGAAGGTVLQVSNAYRYWYPDMARAVPFNPNTLYRIEVRVRVTVDNTDASPNELFYAGIRRIDQTGAVVAGNLYVAASTQSIVAADGWVRYVGWLKGTGAAKNNSWDPNSPGGVDSTDVAWIAPMVLLNYQSPVGQVTQLDYIRIDAVSTELHDQLFDELLDLELAVDAVENVLLPALEDGVISAAEAIAINELKPTLLIQYEEFIQEYDDVVGHPLLSGTPETELIAARNALVAEYSTLIAAIDAAIDGDEVTSGERTALEAAFTAWRTDVKAFRQKVTAALDAIREAGLNTQIDEVYDAIDLLDDTMNIAFRDSVIDEAEATAIGKTREALVARFLELNQEFTEVYGNADLTGTPKTNLNNAWVAWSDDYTDLVNAIDAIIAAETVNSTLLATYNAAVSAFNGTLATLAERFEEARDAIKERGVLKAYEPTVDTSTDTTGTTSVVLLTVKDPKLRVTNVQWQLVVQGIPEASLSSSFDTQTDGVAGVDATLLRRETVTVDEGKDAYFYARVTFTDADGSPKNKSVEIPLTNLQPRIVTRTYGGDLFKATGLTPGAHQYSAGRFGTNGTGFLSAAASFMAPAGSTIDAVRLYVHQTGTTQTLQWRISAASTTAVTGTDIYGPGGGSGVAGITTYEAFPDYETQPDEAYVINVSLQAPSGGTITILSFDVDFDMPSYSQV